MNHRVDMRSQDVTSIDLRHSKAFMLNTGVEILELGIQYGQELNADGMPTGRHYIEIAYWGGDNRKRTMVLHDQHAPAIKEVAS